MRTSITFINCMRDHFEFVFISHWINSYLFHHLKRCLCSGNFSTLFVLRLFFCMCSLFTQLRKKQDLFVFKDIWGTWCCLWACLCMCWWWLFCSNSRSSSCSSTNRVHQLTTAKTTTLCSRKKASIALNSNDKTFL